MEDFKLKGKVVLDDSGFKSGLNDLKSQGESFGSSFKNSMFGVMTAANLASKGVELLVSTLRSAVSEFTLLDKNIAKVNTLLDQQVLSSTNLRMELLRVSSATGIYASELANASYEALSAGVETQNLTGFIEEMTVLSQGGFTSVTQAVNVTTSIMNAYGKEVYAANEISDKLVKTQALGKTTVDELSRSLYNVVPSATAMNVGLDDVLASIAVLTASGTPTASATTQIRQALLEMGDEGSKVGKAIENLTGKSFKQLMKEGYSVSKVIKLLSEESEKGGKSIDGLYSSAEAKNASISLAKKGVEDFTKAIDGIGDSAGESAKAQAIAVDNMVDSWSKLAVQITNKFVSEGGVFSGLNSHLITFVKNTVDILGYAGSLIATFIVNTGKALGTIISAPDTIFQAIMNKNKTETYQSSTNNADGSQFEEEYNKPPAPDIVPVGTIDGTGGTDGGSKGKVQTPEQLARETERKARDLEIQQYEKFRIDKAKMQSDFDIQQIDKDIEFFNQISDLRNQNLLSEADIDLMYDDYQYERFLEEQAFKEEQLQSDLTFYANKKQYAEEYLQTLADLKQVEVDTLSAKIDKEKEIKDREISLQNTWEKNKESIYRKSYQTLVNSNKNVLKAMGDFALQSIAMIMQETGQELFVRGMKDMFIGKAKATLTVTAPAIAAEGVLQDLRGAQAVAAGLALGAAGSAVSSLGSSSSSSD
ncbi:MAG: phage tail tape measure protein, partial [Paraclostridium sp.]